ncbi:MAG: GDP-mannose 4,6-dehydratase [Promethearchaeota archaeon]
MIKNKNILISGGAGFIGSHLFENLIIENNYIIIIDNFNEYYSGKEKNVEEITKNYENLKDYHLIRGDLLNKSIFKSINCDIDIIFHLAAQPGVRYSIQHAGKTTNNNIISTLNILEYAVNNNVKKFIYASSSSVYGNPIYTPVDEEHPKNPISPYAVSKLCCEMYVDYFFREYNLPTITLRFYTVYGPRGRPDMAISKFFNLVFQNQKIIVYGDGKQLRDFTYVSDIVNGLILSCESRKSSGEIFNLGHSSPISVNQLVEKIYKIAKKPKNIIYAEKQKGDVDITHSDINKAKTILNFNPQISIDEGLQKTYNWLRKSVNK